MLKHLLYMYFTISVFFFGLTIAKIHYDDVVVDKILSVTFSPAIKAAVFADKYLKEYR